MQADEIRRVVAAYIVEEFLYGENSHALTDETRLIDEQILDSLTTIRLIQFLENTYNIKLEAHDVIDSLGTLPDIVELVLLRTA